MRVTVDFSPRYFVVGLYLDRSLDIVRVYPVPFVRINFISKYADYRDPARRQPLN